MIRQRSRQGVRVRGRARRDYVVLSTWAEGPTVRVNYEGRCKLAEYGPHRRGTGRLEIPLLLD